MVSDSILQLTLRNNHLLNCGVVTNKNIHTILKILLKSFSLFQLTICVKQNCSHLLQPKHQNTLKPKAGIRTQLPPIKLYIKYNYFKM